MRLQQRLVRTNTTMLVFFLSVFTFLCVLPMGAQGQTTWDGSEADDNWFNANNWDTGIVPNGITVDAIVGAPSPTFFNSAVSLNSLTVGADGILNANWHLSFGGTATTTLDNSGLITVGPAADFQLSAQVNNSGSIELNSTGSPADLLVVSSGATLDDGGTVTFNHPNARISGQSGAMLTIADQTLQGYGQIGSNSVEIINTADGFIDANSAGNTLTFDTSTAGGVNQGTMQASSGGILRINGSNLNNTGSSIQALAGSTVELSGNSGASANITGGTLSGAGTFSIVAGQFGGLTDLTFSAAMNVENNAHLRMTGNINNTGSISVNSTGQVADLQIQAAGATLDGGGTVTFTHDNAKITGSSGATLTIADHTLQGFGNIGDNDFELINTSGGLIDANSTGNTLVVDTSTAGGVNQGTMRASAGGILRINGSNINNTGGSIQALTGSTVELTGGSDITGGTLSGAGTFNAVSGQTGILTDLTHSATIEVNNNSHLGLAGTINNTGSISVNSTGQVADLQIQAAGATLDGGGTITLNHNNAQINGPFGTTLTIANQTIQGTGNVGKNELVLINNGSILADGPTADLLIDTINGPGGLTNNGLIRASNGGLIRLENQGHSENGSIEAIGAGSRVNRSNSGTSIVVLGSVRVVDGGDVSIYDTATFDSDTGDNTAVMEFRGTGSYTDIFNDSSGFLHIDDEPLVGATPSTPGDLHSNRFSSNSGEFRIGDGLNFTAGNLNTGDFVNSGVINVQADSRFAAAGWSGGIISDGEGGSAVLPSSYDSFISSGRLEGTGTIANTNSIGGGGPGNLLIDNSTIQNDGTIAPGDNAEEVGTLSLLARNLILGDTSIIEIEIGAAGSDRVDIQTTSNAADIVALNGELEVSLLNGFVPSAGSTFDVFTAANGLDDTFDTLTLPNLGGGLEWDINYGANAVTLEVFLPGDFDEDGDVDGSDFLEWQRNPAVASLTDWQNNYGTGSSGLQAITAVPEPSTILLAMAALLSAGRARWRKGSLVVDSSKI